MGTAMRFVKFLVTSKYFRFTPLRNVSLRYPSLRLRSIKKPKNVEEIPDIEKLWPKFRSMKIAEFDFKKQMLDELISESLVHKSYESLHYLEKIFMIQTGIGTLMKRNVVPSVNSVVNAMLSHLETFPFDSDAIKQNENDISIILIRNTIEKQYLAWKYKLDLDDLGNILHRYRQCLYEFRSLSNLRRNISLLEKFSKTSKLCVAEKIYHLNQKPFHVKSAIDFQDTIAGLNWQLFPRYCPKILQHSHQYILFVISLLRDMNFTEKQIQGGLPFLHFSFETFIRKLNQMLASPQIAKHRDEDKFLHLLSYQAHILHDLVNLRQASFVELTEMVSISSKSLTGRVRLITAKSILYHINQFYTIGNNYAKLIKKHAKYRLVSEKQILDTLTFLKNENFTDSELAESLTIVLYPRSVIEKILESIHLKASTLQKYGFENGSLSQETNNFEHGTKEKRKILQLCLYYLEKPYHFSGDGIWEYKDSSELDTNNKGISPVW